MVKTWPHKGICVRIENPIKHPIKRISALFVIVWFKCGLSVEGHCQQGNSFGFKGEKNKFPWIIPYKTALCKGSSLIEFLAKFTTKKTLAMSLIKSSVHRTVNSFSGIRYVTGFWNVYVLLIARSTLRRWKSIRSGNRNLQSIGLQRSRPCTWRAEIIVSWLLLLLS